jgi:hypothetical protein
MNRQTARSACLPASRPSQSQSYFMTDGLLLISSHWQRALRLTTSHFLQLNTYDYSPFVSVIYDCCWPSPAESFSGLSPTGLITTFDCLRFKTPPTGRPRSLYLYPPGTGWPNHTPRHWVPFSSPPTTHRVTEEVFDPTGWSQL